METIDDFYFSMIQKDGTLTILRPYDGIHAFRELDGDDSDFSVTIRNLAYSIRDELLENFP